MSKPVDGQWYEWQEQRVYCVGQDSHGHTIVNHECGTLNVLRGKLIDELTHLPDCTGWDWEEWVEITDPEHVVRECDYFNPYKVHPEGGWTACCGSVGIKRGTRPDLGFRCRRKDLPAKKRTVTVPKWLCLSGASWHVLDCSKPIGFDEVHLVGETTYEI